MITYMLILLFSSVLAAVLASNGDSQWLLSMMLGVPEEGRAAPPTYQPPWDSVDKESLARHKDNWLSEGSKYDGLYSIPERNRRNHDHGSDRTLNKKWSNQYLFSGLICCNSPPTPDPKRKQEKRTNEDDLRGILLKAISRSMAKNRADEETVPMDNRLSESVGRANYNNYFRPSLDNLPMMGDRERMANSESQFYREIPSKRVKLPSTRATKFPFREPLLPPTNAGGGRGKKSDIVVDGGVASNPDQKRFTPREPKKTYTNPGGTRRKKNDILGTLPMVSIIDPASYPSDSQGMVLKRQQRNGSNSEDEFRERFKGLTIR